MCYCAVDMGESSAHLLNHRGLQAEWERVEDSLPDNLRLRMRRALSWLGRAEQETDDPDAAFIFYWIAFNAAYARDRSSEFQRQERNLFGDYFEIILRIDSEYTIHNAIRDRFSDLIEPLLNNKFVYKPFWDERGGLDDYDDWLKSFYKSRSNVDRAIDRADTLVVLNSLFDRLYVLRNQLMHGGATWQGSINRAQVGDGARIMAFLVPLFVSLMMSHPETDWGYPDYPVVR